MSCGSEIEPVGLRSHAVFCFPAVALDLRQSRRSTLNVSDVTQPKAGMLQSITADEGHPQRLHTVQTGCASLNGLAREHGEIGWSLYIACGCHCTMISQPRCLAAMIERVFWDDELTRT